MAQVGACPRVSVFIPTKDHAATLPYAVRSVQAQGVDDLEILIGGDGVTDAVRGVVVELQRADRRIRFFDLAKAPARGEINRDHVIRQARGHIVFHQDDDDLWLPGHIGALEEALVDADFVGAIQVNVDPGDKLSAHFFDLERPEFVEPWLDWRPNEFGAWACNGFGPIFVAYRLDAYLRLPEGWTTTPEGLPADQVMWHKFMRQNWCRAKFLRWPVALHFPAPDRRDWSPDQRAAELRYWTEIIERPDYAARLWRELLPDLSDRLLRQSLDVQQMRCRLERALESETAARADAERVLRQERAATEEALRKERARAAEAGRHERMLGEARWQRERAVAEAALQGAVAALSRAERERDALLSSTSWRITGPLRQAKDWLQLVLPERRG